jgi:RecA-family ATPase
MNIFPATLTKEGSKVPLIKNWQKLATSDPAQIKLWQDHYRDRITFWGIPTGELNGFFAFDVDIKTNGWKTIQDLGLQIPNTACQKTLNGGSHFLFKFDPSKDTGNKVGFLPGLDLRSSGGWIAHYGLDFTYPIADAPEWLYHYASVKKESPQVVKSTVRLIPEIAEGIFKESIDAIINAAQGESNDTLNRESFKVGQLVASQSISREFAEAELFKAAKLRGKPDYESRETIKSGLDGGRKHPLLCPFPAEEPKSSFQIPDPPGAQERWTPRYMTRDDLVNTSKLRKPQLFRDWSSIDILLTSADGGTGKTTLKLYEAVCLALGDRFLGFECLQQGKTLFLTGEDSAEKLMAMVGAIVRQMGLFDGTSENEYRIKTILKSIVIKKDADLCLITQDRQGFLHPNKGAMNKIMEAVDDLKPSLIVFDPIASFWGSESKLNDMNKAVTKFASELVDRSGAAVEFINHIGKSSSASKDMTQYAGRGGSGLPSNSRISRVLLNITQEEYQDLTGMDLVGDQTAMICNVNKFTDGSPLLNKKFLIIRDKYLFSRITLSPQKAKEMEKQLTDNEKVFTWIKTERTKNKYPSSKNVIGHFMNNGSPMSEARIKRAISDIIYHGHLGEKVIEIDNPDLTKKDKALTIADSEGNEA